MPEISKEQLRNHIKTGSFAPVYLLHGSEAYLRDIAARTIADRAFAEGELREFNDDRFSLTDPDEIVRALAAAEQLPMMAARRVIRISDVRVAAAANRDTLKEDALPRLEKYLADPAPSTLLIFIADELNGNRKATKLLKLHAAAVEFAQLEGRELEDWVRRQFQELGAEPADGAVRFLIATAGSELQRLSNEIKKLAAAAMPEGRVTVEMIEAVVPHSRELSNFDLTDHLIAGRKDRALKVLRKLFDDEAEPLMLLGLIASRYRSLLAAKELMERGVDRGTVAKRAKIFGPGADDVFAAARRADRQRLASAIQKMAAADLAIKTSVGGGGKSGAEMQIEMLVCELAEL
ncbi:MAG TPA: DNA polymerase III subunit delta [Pyrinomonadaceae bacterium]|nr:DNA polymerase III subunit delta [Pyrinomonadaceae bacterium]